MNFFDAFVNSVWTRSFETLATPFLDLILEKSPYLVTIFAAIVTLRRWCFLGLLCSIACILFDVNLLLLDITVLCDMADCNAQFSHWGQHTNLFATF